MQRRNIAEFGNHEANGGVRIVVEIGDGAKLAGQKRTINYTVDGTAIRGAGKDYTIKGCSSSTCSVTLPANRHSAVITIYVNNDDLDETRRDRRDHRPHPGKRRRRPRQGEP